MTTGTAGTPTALRAASTGDHQHPGYQVQPRHLLVAETVDVTPSIRHVVLVDAAGGPLAGYEPGSHLIVSAGPYRNAYSLVGDGVNPYEYAVSVLRRGAGGGSDWIHQHLTVGQHILVEGPRSHFAPAHAQRHALLVAGGIGITPILSHARAARRWGRTAEVVYAYRPGSGAHLDELRELVDAGAISLFEATDSGQMTSLLQQRLADQPLGTHAYACGPTGLLDSYLELGRQAGWPDVRLHLEHFEAPAPPPGADFTALLTSTGEILDVASGVSLLDRLLASGVSVPFLCRQGVCGECSIPVRAGKIEHRDHVLTPAEREAANRMICCVSRGENIEVDL